jgi:predicted nucleic acid-binding Zn ribbon protein
MGAPPPPDGARPIGEAMQRWLAQRGIAQRRLAGHGVQDAGAGADPVPLAAAVACWPAVAGEQLAAHARPLRLEGTVLVVAVDQPALAAELGFRATELLARLNECAGAPIASACKVIVRGTLGLE